VSGSAQAHITTAGVGELGLAIGLDVAHSKNQNAVYVQVGSTWR
jgi:hypothetical protein